MSWPIDTVDITSSQYGEEDSAGSCHVIRLLADAQGATAGLACWLRNDPRSRRCWVDINSIVETPS